MNFLAHAWLAGDDPAHQLGGLMGDFVKGPLPAGLPTDIAAGVALHRRIDVFADGHPAFCRSRGRISPARRRAAGILVDMFYDHFLALHWSDFHPEPLPAFTARMYALMDAHHRMLPPRLAGQLPSMRKDDWLASYRSAEIVAFALDRMSSRLSRPEMLLGGAAELEKHYAGFEADFFEFVVDAKSFARLAIKPSEPAEKPCP
ncbi:ACP phosphodiesterase [Azoarcus taiwanensis]|uniref:DUF479 domain-containing protein n=1 Tax=Azoarcus taiwanensis TaxID=666964 RepID=A0A972FAL5_9RHOO|nr:ACP phosphodiesterase [Azoarcus taiwanensis]NMG03194.1 DUF479 domain-containing protein [Azoarcus taiwanensis]